MNTEWSQALRQRQWKRLEQMLQEDYSYVQCLVQTIVPSPEWTELADVLVAVLDHTRNSELKQCMFNDFANFLSLQLSADAEFVEYRPDGEGSDEPCTICFEKVEPTEIGVLHRVCNQVIAHSECLDKWWQVVADKECLCCKKIINNK